MSARVSFYPHPALSLGSRFRHVILCSHKNTYDASERLTEKALSASFKIPNEAVIFINSTFLHFAISKSREFSCQSFNSVGPNVQKEIYGITADLLTFPWFRTFSSALQVHAKNYRIVELCRNPRNNLLWGPDRRSDWLPNKSVIWLSYTDTLTLCH